MGRPKGSKNKMTGNGETPAIGHNNPPVQLTEEQRRALLLQAIDEIMPQKEKLTSLVGKIRGIYKRFKADGVSKKDIDFAISLKGMEAEQASKTTARYLEIVAWCHPGVQAELFPDFEQRAAE